MKRSWYAANARTLLQQRRQGVLPTKPVNVNLDIGHELDLDGYVLTLRSDEPTERIDWRMLVNLDVWVWADETQPLQRVLDVVRDIVAVKPKGLYIRFVDPFGHIHDVDCGSGTHTAGAPEHGIPAEHSFLFFPINSGGTRLGRHLCRALMPLTTAER